MNRDKVKLIIKNLELLIECLKLELDDKTKETSSIFEDTVNNTLVDYDEVFDDEEDDYHPYIKLGKNK